MLASKPITTTGAGTFTLIPAVAGRAIFVKRLIIVADAGITSLVKFQDSNGNAITGQMALAAGQPLVVSTPADSTDFEGIMNVAAGAGLQVVVAAGNTGGQIQYTQ